MKEAVNSILTYLDRNTALEDRVRYADEIERMIETTGWGVFSDFLAKATADAREQVEFGTHEHTEYAAMHGRIRGLRYAQSITEAIVESGKRADIELRQIAVREENV